MIIDGHRHIVQKPDPILKEMDSLGIDRTVLVGIGVSKLDDVTVTPSFIFQSNLLLRTLGCIHSRKVVRSLRRSNNLLSKPRNDATQAAMKQNPDRFYGFAFVNPESPGLHDDLRSCLDAGMQGIKLALLQYPTNLFGTSMQVIVEMAMEYNVPLFVHFGLDAKHGFLNKLFSAFPDVRFIVAHAGVQYFNQLIAIDPQKHKNVFIDLSSYFVTHKKLSKLVKTFPISRLLYGSDCPVMARSAAEGINKIRKLDLPQNSIDQILGENISSLLV